MTDLLADTNIDEFLLVPHDPTHGSLDLRYAMVDDGVVVNHSLEDGGWELEVTVADPAAQIRQHMMFGIGTEHHHPAIDVELDGRWFRLRSVSRDTDGTLTMTFTDRYIDRLARQHKPVVTSRGKNTRREFLVARASKVVPHTYSPQLHKKKHVLTPEEEQAHTNRQPDADADASGGKDMGNFESTSYGPPWGGIQGQGVTANGTVLTHGPHKYGIAIDPHVLKMNKHYYVWPNPFDHKGAFVAFDTGGAIKGHRIDFYDWRGRTKQNGWGRQNVNVSTAKNFASVDDDGNQQVAVSYKFKVGEMQQDGTRRNWWEDILDLSNEINIRSFVDNGVFICMSEEELAASKPVATLTHDDCTMSWSDDNGDQEKTMQIELDCDRWSFAPGSCVLIKQEGRMSGRYIVVSKSRSAFSTLASITLRKPLPEKPEPAHELRPASDVTDDPDNKGPIGNTFRGSPIPGEKPHAATHQTAGLPGYPAYDYMAAAGTPVVAPVSGKVTRLSGHNPKTDHPSPGGAHGYSIYIHGTNGWDYFLTHLDHRQVKAGDKVEQGQKIAEVADGPASWSSPHCHMGINKHGRADGSPSGGGPHDSRFGDR